MKLEIPSLKKIKFSSLGKRLNLVLTLVLILLVVGEGLALKNSADLILAANKEPNFVAKPLGVRINFDAYHAVEQRIESGPNYVPADVSIPDPFNPSPLATSTLRSFVATSSPVNAPPAN